ncbi:MAG: YihY/virulence factor BrkB family protein [Desulfuromonadaceae bacterium]|nr:YihY/virulence factor BrkB family protein [Desulfuromonadaceae bacterium]
MKLFSSRHIDWEHTYGFPLRVLRGFISNQGLLLSAAVAYYTLLSIVPLSIIALVVLTHFIEERQLILTLSMYLEMVIPGYATTLTEQVSAFLEHRTTVGFMSFLGMLFFSSTAFSMLENAISVIFYQRLRVQRRRFFISAIIPYLYIGAMGLGVLLVSVIVGAIETVESRYVSILGWSFISGSVTWWTLYVLGIIGEVLLLTSIYLVMPVIRVRFRHALIGGVTATFLWEITRRILVWYYATISTVNVIYGSISITVVALLSIEVVAIILLLGAQVIAELEHPTDKTAHIKQ